MYHMSEIYHIVHYETKICYLLYYILYSAFHSIFICQFFRFNWLQNTYRLCNADKQLS